MRVRLDANRRHPRAEVACPPLGWRAVGRRVVLAGGTGTLAAACAALAVLHWRHTAHSASAMAAALLAGVCTASVLWLTHLLNAARTPVTFKIAHGELIVVKPFLFMR